MVVEDKFNSSARGKRFLPFNTRAERTWTEDFSFIQAADTQFGMQESYIEKKEEVGWQQEIDWSTELVNRVNSMQPQPRFMVICGDLLDAWPATQSAVRSKQENDFKSVFKHLKVPCVCVCGNHDIGNQPSMESVKKYRSAFGEDFFSFWCGGVYFLVINSQYYEDSTNVPQIAAEQEDWLEQELKRIKRKKPKHAVVFQHIPLFLHHPDEPKEYFNFAPDLRRKLLERFHDAGIRHVFSGHYHRNAGGMYRDLQMVVTSAVGAQLGGDKQGYRVVNVSEDKIQHRYVNIELISIPPTVAYSVLRAYLDLLDQKSGLNKPLLLGSPRLKAA